MKKTIRRIFGRCPYCGEKMLDGMGGNSLLFMNSVKMCPNRHYAEELHSSGATFVYDNGGQPLEVNDDL